MRSIPMKLLIHTAMRHKVVEKDRMGKKTLDEGLELKHVRVEPVTKVIRDRSGAEVQLAATLFYDCKNSTPRNLEFAIDDIILFLGQKFSVQLVEPFFDEKKLHHYELGLIRHA